MRFTFQRDSESSSYSPLLYLTKNHSDIYLGRQSSLGLFPVKISQLRSRPSVSEWLSVCGNPRLCCLTRQGEALLAAQPFFLQIVLQSESFSASPSKHKLLLLASPAGLCCYIHNGENSREHFHWFDYKQSWREMFVWCESKLCNLL